MEYLQAQEVKMPEIKVWNGQRVVTFKDIDEVHQRPDGTSRRNFNANKKRFVEGEDYFKLKPKEIRTHKLIEISPKARENVVFLTETGYLMIVKSLTDDLAWKVQRQLVNSYFKVKEDPSPCYALPTTSLKRLPKKTNWYMENKEQINKVVKHLDTDHKTLFAFILKQLDRKFDLYAAREIYRNERGFYPQYATDIISYFDELNEEAAKILNHLEVYPV